MQGASVLSKTHLRKLASKSVIASVSSKDKLHVAFQRLVEGRFYSVPVLDADSSKFLGLLPLHSVVLRIVQLFAQRCGGVSHLAQHTFTPKDVADVQYEFNALGIDRELILKVETRGPGLNLQEAIDFFNAPGNDRSQVRLPIVEEDGSIANLVSPTMILKFIGTHLAELPESLVGRPIRSIPGVISPNVVTCRSTDRALDAFADMVGRQHHYSALGIEDAGTDHRSIISIVSVKDIGHALKDFSRLLLPVEQFVNDIRSEDLVDRAPTMNVADDASVGIVVRKFLAVDRHRMFVRSGQQLVGIVTVSDLLKAFAIAE